MQVKRRSLLHARLLQAGAHFAEENGAEIATSFGAADEVQRARHLGLTDLSPLPRIGYKGAGAVAWLQQQGITLPPQPNRACMQADGTCVAALSAQEHLLLPPLNDSSGDSACQQLTAAWSLDSAAQCYQLPRADSHCWLALSGVRAGDMLAKVCGVDLRPQHFAPGAVAQTSLARVNAIVLRLAFGEVPVFHLLADSASGEYLWDCLCDAMDEYGGAAVGLVALRQLADVPAA